MWLCHMAFEPNLIRLFFSSLCSAGPQAELPTSLCTLSMPSFHVLAQCLAEPKSPQLGAEVLFMICPSLQRHPQSLLLGTLCQGHHLLGPTPLTPTSNNKKIPSLFSTQLQDFSRELHWGIVKKKKGMDFRLRSWFCHVLATSFDLVKLPNLKNWMVFS